MNSFSNGAPSRMAKATLIAIAVVQGCLLLMLHKLLDNNLWPDKDPAWLYLLFTLVIIIPATLLVVLREPGDKWPWVLVLCYAVLLSPLSLYSGYQCEPENIVRCNNIAFAYVLTLAVSWFIALFFIQTWLDRKNWSFSYSLLFNYSWQNYLTLKLAALFVGIFWSILGLWAALFDALEIAFFKELFKSEWFVYPVTGLVAGLGIVIFRFQINAVGTLRSILAALMRALLPLLAFVSLLFLFTVLFAGLAPLWKTGHGTLLLLWLTALVLFFVNAVYQDGAGDRPYGLLLHRIIQIAIAAQVFFLAFCLYGLSLRVGQHGWTVGRLWGLVITLIFSGFVLAYSISIVRKRDRWLDWLKPVNKGMALFIVAVCLLVNSPVLDFRKISVASQLARLDAGEISAEDFDYRYFAHTLARPGYLALENLKNSEPVTSNPKLAADIDFLMARPEYRDRSEEKTRDGIRDYVSVYPEQAEPSAALLDLVFDSVKGGNQCIRIDSGCFLVETNLNDVSGPEFVLIVSGKHWTDIKLFEKGSSNKWEIVERGMGYQVEGKAWQAAEIEAALKKGDYRAMPSEWKDLHIGGQRLFVR